MPLVPPGSTYVIVVSYCVFRVEWKPWTVLSSDLEWLIAIHRDKWTLFEWLETLYFLEPISEKWITFFLKPSNPIATQFVKALSGWRASSTVQRGLTRLPANNLSMLLLRLFCMFVRAVILCFASLANVLFYSKEWKSIDVLCRNCCKFHVLPWWIPCLTKRVAEEK